MYKLYIFILGVFVVNLTKAETSEEKPLRANLDGTCQPNSYVHLDCNVCQCNSDGQIDWEHCTKKECNQEGIKSRRADPPRRMNVHGSCEVNSWYSLAPCQFCYCASNNRLVCSTGSPQAKSLQLGMYNVTVCGPNLIKDALELVPEGQEAVGQGLVNQQPKAEVDHPKQLRHGNNHGPYQESSPNQYRSVDGSHQENNYDNKQYNQENRYQPSDDVFSQQHMNREDGEPKKEKNKEHSDAEVDSLETAMKQAIATAKKSSPQLSSDDDLLSSESEEVKAKKHKNKHHKEINESRESMRSKRFKATTSPGPIEQQRNDETQTDKASLLGPNGILTVKLPQVFDNIMKMSFRKSNDGDADEVWSQENDE